MAAMLSDTTIIFTFKLNKQPIFYCVSSRKVKTITVIRHCKSDWSYHVDDHDRPLNARGKANIPMIGERLSELNCKPDIVYHSSATRAKQTALGINKSGNLNWSLIELRELYTFDASVVLNFIQNQSDDLKHIGIVAHNPGLTDLINRLTTVRLDNLPTGGFAQIEFDTDNWSNIGDQPGRLVFLEYPKML